jgi:anti-sigma factor RsiW
MDCAQATPLLLDFARGRLSPELTAEVERHVAGCQRCRVQLERERGLDAALRLLPRPALPAGLASQLAANPRARWRPRWEQVAVLVAAAACVGLFLVARQPAPDRLVEEAVNDHLRQLIRATPMEIASSDHHQVKPWFAGKVDFAPVIHFEGDADFPLVGGSVGYFIDRKAAVFSYARRLHAISLFVMPASGLRWPPSIDARSARGFNVLLWREGELAYALVSDLNEAELRQLAVRIRGGGEGA